MPSEAKGFFAKSREIFRQLVHGHESADQIALGVALGVFLGIVPTFGLAPVIALVGAWLFGFNRLAAVLGGLVMNPLSAPFFWTLSGMVGMFFLPGQAEALMEKVASLAWKWELLKAFFQEEGWGQDLKSAVVVYLVGNGVVALIFSLFSYILTRKMVLIYRRRRKRC